MTTTTSINLSSLDGTNGFHVDAGGGMVSNAGDINGDGFDDVIFGASYVVFGKASGFSSTLDLSSLDGNTGFRLLGGRSASNAGDVNGDGFNDVIIGTNSYSSYGDAGYVVFGKASGFSAQLDLSTLDGDNGFILHGTLHSLVSSTYSVSSAGDVNDDGFDDVILGGGGVFGGAGYVVFGKASGFDDGISLHNLDGNNGFKLDEGAYDGTGAALSGAGDVNGDGFDDVIIADNTGSSYVVFGKASGFNAALDLFSLDGINGFRLGIMPEPSYSIRSVSNAGDVNGDGFDDVILGAPAADQNGSYSGSSFVVFGTASGVVAALDLSTLDGGNGFRLNGDAGDAAGTSVSNAGDVNGDGFDDVIIGAPGADPNGDNSGFSYVVFGKASGFSAAINLSSLDSNTSVRLNGVTVNSRSGYSVSGAGDVNGDGFDDLMIGAQPIYGYGSSASYVIFGNSQFIGTVTYLGTSADDTLTGTSADERFDAGDGNDTMIGGGGADIFNGGAGNDTISLSDLDFQVVDGGTGTDTLRLTGDGIHLDLVDFHDRIHGIESFDLRGSGDNTLTFSLSDLLSLSDTSHTFTVDGNAGDRVIGLSNGWGDDGIDGQYHIYTNRGTILRIDLAVSTDTPTPGVINLPSLNGSDGFRMDGVMETDYLGRSVSSAGDVNGDGFADVIIGAPYADPIGVASGSSYVVFGKASGFDDTLDLSSLNGNNGFRLDGVAAFDKTGRSVSNAGDVNGDGFDDVIVGNGDDFYVGTSYVVFGKASGFEASLELSSLDGKNGFGLEGETRGDSSGFSVSGAGDINGDGFDDVIVGAPKADPHGFSSGSSYVVFGKGKGFGATLNLSNLNGNNGFRLDGTLGSTSGESVSSAGDINSDGFDDLVIGSHGSGYVVFGKATGFSATMDLSNLDGINGFRLNGVPDDYSSVGRSVSNAGDVNGDGFADLIVEAQRAVQGGVYYSSNYVVFGKASGFGATLELSTLNGNNGFRLVETSGNSGSEFSVSDAGDFNGDGFDDLFVGNTGVSGYSDVSYIVFGKASGFDAVVSLSNLDDNNVLRLDGEVPGEFTHIAISSAGDVNGDGFDDVIVGDPNAPSKDENSYSGSSYVIFGRSDFTGEVDFPGTTGNDIFTGTSAAESFEGEEGDDRMIGRGGADSFDGGAGNDYIRISDDSFQLADGGAGTDILGLAGSGFNLNLSSVINKIHGIETISLYGIGDNSLTLTAQDIIDLSDSTDTLKIKGNAGDSVIGLSSGWLDGGVHGNFHLYTQDDAVLLIGVEVATDFA